jgi:basic membrane lipoprotein Med (substrate-binding protein (PBP1-ABC) superfamily)
MTIAREVVGGTFQPKVETFGLKSQVVRFDVNPAYASKLPAELVTRVKAASDSIAAGTLNPVPTP